VREDPPLHVAVPVDPFTNFGWDEVFIPFVSHYRPLWMAFGIIALYIGIAIGISTWLHWLQVVETFARVDIAPLRTGCCTWNRDRKRHGHLVGYYNLLVQYCPSWNAALESADEAFKC
jgi:hypothetical protein